MSSPKSNANKATITIGTPRGEFSKSSSHMESQPRRTLRWEASPLCLFVAALSFVFSFELISKTYSFEPRRLQRNLHAMTML